MKYKYYTADVFTDKPFFGVPLPVFPDASGLTDEQMQQLASELSTSSTVFLFSGQEDHSRKIRVFTPQKEVAANTHTILAASFILTATGSVALNGRHTLVSLEGAEQSVDTYVTQQEGKPTLVQQTYDTHAAIDYYTPTEEELAAMLSLTPADIGFEHYRPLIVSCGVPYLIVPIKSYHAIREARFNLSAWSNSTAPSSLAQEILLFANNTDDNPADFHARLIGPAIAFHEDPPIGGAIAAFASHICDHPHVQEGTHTFAIQRGANDARKSILHVEMDNKKTKDLTIRVGGSAVLMSEAEISF